MKDRIALVTGSAMEIGLACAEAFAREGATVVLADIRKPDEQAQALVDAGHKAVAYECDVSDAQAVKMMIDWIVTTYGRLDAALNNAGTHIRTATIYPAAVQSELVAGITDGSTSEGYRKLYDAYEIPAERIANVVAFALSQPDDTNVSEFTVGPATQPW